VHLSSRGSCRVARRISTSPDISIIATDTGTHGASEAPVKIVMSPAQAADLARRLQALLDELHA